MVVCGGAVSGGGLMVLVITMVEFNGGAEKKFGGFGNNPNHFCEEDGNVLTFGSVIIGELTEWVGDGKS